MHSKRLYPIENQTPLQIHLRDSDGNLLSPEAMKQEMDIAYAMVYVISWNRYWLKVEDEILNGTGETFPDGGFYINEKGQRISEILGDEMRPDRGVGHGELRELEQQVITQESKDNRGAGKPRSGADFHAAFSSPEKNRVDPVAGGRRKRDNVFPKQVPRKQTRQNKN